MSSANTSEVEKKEQYGDPIRFRLASEYWHIMDELQPNVLAALEYISQTHHIDNAWLETMQSLGTGILELKWSIDGFKNLLTKDDAATVRPFKECFALSLNRDGRVEVSHGKMDGRAELYARRKLQLEDMAVALYLQSLDIRAVAFKNKMWDITNRPETKPHGLKA